MIKNKPIFNLVVNLLLLALRDCEALKSLIIKVPKVAKSGDTVTLACEYDLEQVALYSIKWYWNEEEFYRFVPKESPPFWAFPMQHINVDVSRSGPTDVTLRGVRRELSGNYKCEVSADAPFFHTDIKTAHMTVAEIPSSDPVLNIDPVKVEIGKTIVADCYSPGSDPAANITWYINDIKLNRSTDDIRLFPLIIESDPALNLHSSRSKIEITANKTFFPGGVMFIKCEASIYTVWHRTVEHPVRDETPLLASVLGSTSSQGHEKYDVLKSSCDMNCFHTSILLQILFFYFIFYAR